MSLALFGPDMLELKINRPEGNYMYVACAKSKWCISNRE